MKRLLALTITAALLLQGFGSNPLSAETAAGETETEAVISAELEAAFEAETDASATYRVMIWLEDIDYDAVWETAETEADTTWEELTAREESIYAEAVSEALCTEAVNVSRLLTTDETAAAAYESVFSLADEEIGLVQEEVNALVAAEREAASELYEEQNQVLTENASIAENVEFVSRYAPMLIAELTQEQIETVAENEMVVGIYEAEAETEIAYEETTALSETAAELTAADSDYTAYLDYLGASTAHRIGLSGAGVKVGLIDGKRVYCSDDSELADSNITTVGVSDSISEHAVYMARILCGTYGMAPDCELYSVYQTQEM